MFLLTREVRFAINADGSPAPDGPNGFAGRPSLTGFGIYLQLQATFQGSLDPVSSYLRNIKDIDIEVREKCVPAIGRFVAEESPVERCLSQLVRLLDESDPVSSTPPVRLVALQLCLSPQLSFSWSATEPLMIRLSQMFEFAAAHRLHNPDFSDEQNLATFGKCNNPMGHGHNYQVKVTIQGVPGKSGVLMPVDQLEKIVEQQLIEHFDHKHLNHQVPEFQNQNPSVELIAQASYRRLKDALAGNGVTLASVTVWETPKTWCEYSE